MQDILFQQWGFDGYYVSDCWALVDFYDGHNIVKNGVEAASLALNTGCNLNCGSTYEYLDEAFDQGLIDEKTIDSNFKQLIKTRFKLGMFDPSYLVPFDTISKDYIRKDSFVELSKEAATKSIVLLENKNDILPLSKEIKSIYVTGPTAADAQILMGNYYGVSENYVTILEGLAAAVSETTKIQYMQGTMLNSEGFLGAYWYENMPRETDVTIACLGISQFIEGEEGEAIASDFKGDRQSLTLPANQINYLKKLRENSEKLVVVITGGAAISIPEIANLADAVLFVWYPGEQGGNAIADIIFGESNPSERLPVTVYKEVSQLPAYEDYSMEGRTYRYFDEEPLYPFGYGLSYCQFEYSPLKVSKASFKGDEKITLECTIKNSSDTDGSDVIQLYVKGNRPEQPNLSLRGFQKAFLKAGEEKIISFTLNSADFGFISESGEKISATGNYEVFVGNSAPMTGDFTVKGSSTSIKYTSGKKRR